MKNIKLLLVISIILTLLLTGCGKTETPAQVNKNEGTITINYADLGLATSNAYLYFGVEKGIYKKYGINLNIVQFTKGGPEIIAAVAGGSLDMGQLGSPILVGISKGVPIKVVGSPAIGKNDFVLVGRNEIKGVEDLKGKTVGVSSIGGGQHQALKKIIQKYGLTEDDVKIIATGTANNGYMAFKSGQIAGIVGSEPWPTKIELDKEGHVLALAKDYFGRYQHSYIFAADKFIKDNPDAIKKFFEANQEAVEYARQHQDELIAFVKKQLNTDDALLAAVFKKDMPDWNSSGKVDVEGLKNAVAIIQQLGEIDKNVSLTDDQLMNLNFTNK